jgi:hypothetical protein
MSTVNSAVVYYLFMALYQILNREIKICQISSSSSQAHGYIMMYTKINTNRRENSFILICLYQRQSIIFK